MTNKKKIINDPVYGFISIHSELVFDLIEHPYFQRLRRIKQLGITNFVYPGATHTRFQHAIGALYLMGQAIGVIRSKGHDITDEEAEAVKIAILLHDIGHGPFSHSLENSIVDDINHESLSEIYMNDLNKQFNNRLDLAIKVFKNQYRKKFLHQLVSSQLDMDRLDYLKRDSFFTGVTEGVIGSDRIIKMLNVVDDNLVIEAKGIYSIEKFLVARRFMYWQVYLHKTVISAEKLLVNILKRAKELSNNGVELFATPPLKFFLTTALNISEPIYSLAENKKSRIIHNFSKLDDNDIITAIKVWSDHDDPVISYLCRCFENRILYRIEIQNNPFNEKEIEALTQMAIKKFEIDFENSKYFVFSESITNNAYNASDDKIKILFKNGKIKDIAETSDMLNITVLSKVIKKHFLCYPKVLTR